MITHQGHYALRLLVLLIVGIPLFIVPSGKKKSVDHTSLKEIYFNWAKENNKNPGPLIDYSAAQTTLQLLHGDRKTTFDANTTTQGFLQKVCKGAAIYYDYSKDPNKQLPPTREALFECITDLTAFLYGCSLGWFRPINEKNEIERTGDETIIFKIKSSQEHSLLRTFFSTYYDSSKSDKTKQWIQDIKVSDSKELTSAFSVNMYDTIKENTTRFRFLENFKKIDTAVGPNEFFIKLEKAPNNTNLNKIFTNFLPITPSVTFFTPAHKTITSVFRTNFPQAPETITSIKAMTEFVKQNANISSKPSSNFYDALKEFSIKNNKPAIEEQESADELCLNEDELYIMSYFMRNPDDVAKNATTQEIDNKALTNFKITRGVFLELRTIKEKVQKAFAQKILEKTPEGFSVNLSSSVIDENTQEILKLKKDILFFCDEAKAALPYINDDKVYDYFNTLSIGLSLLFKKHETNLHFLFKEPLFDIEYLHDFMAAEALALLNKKLSGFRERTLSALSEDKKNVSTNIVPFDAFRYTNGISFLNSLTSPVTKETSAFISNLKKSFENKTALETELPKYLETNSAASDGPTALFVYTMKTLYSQNNPSFFVTANVILEALTRKKNSELIKSIGKKAEAVVLLMQTQIVDILKQEDENKAKKLKETLEKLMKDFENIYSKIFIKKLPDWGIMTTKAVHGAQMAQNEIEHFIKKNTQFSTKQETLKKNIPNYLIVAPTITAFKHKVWQKAEELAKVD